MDSKQPDLQIIGFGKLAQQLLLNIGRESSILEDTKRNQVRLTIIDHEANRKVKRMISMFPRLSEVINFYIAGYYPWGIIFLWDCFSVFKDFSPILLGFDDEDANLSTRLGFQSILMGTNRIFIISMISGNNLSAFLCEDHPPKLPTLFRIFYTLKEVCSADMIDKGSFEDNRTSYPSGLFEMWVWKRVTWE